MYLISRSWNDFLLFISVLFATTVTSSKSSNETVISSFTAKAIHQENLDYESTSVKAMHESMHQNRHVKRDPRAIYIPLKETTGISPFGTPAGYYAEIYIDDPSKINTGNMQLMRLNIDVASNTTWVKGNRCTTCGGQGYLFNLKRSSARMIHPVVSIEHFSVSGPIYKSNFIFNDGNSLDGKFLVADRVTKNNDLRVQGTFGLGYIPESRRHEESAKWNIFSNWIDANYKPVFSLYLGPIGSGESHLILGGVNRPRGEIGYSSQVGNPGPNWRVKIQHVLVNFGRRQQRIEVDQFGIIKTGYAEIVGPLDKIKQIFHGFEFGVDSILTETDNEEHTLRFYGYPIQCTKHLNLIFKIAGIDYEMNPADMIIGQAENECIGMPVGFKPLRGPPKSTWILGTAFLRNVYVIFDLLFHRIGFISIYSSAKTIPFIREKDRPRRNPEPIPFLNEIPGFDDISMDDI